MKIIRSISIMLLLATAVAACAQEPQTFADVADEPIKILTIGDSIYRSFGRDANIPTRVGETLGVPIVNSAKGGAFFSLEDPSIEDPQMDIRQQWVEQEAGWDWVIMDGGGNDLNSECGCGECDETLNELITEDGTAGLVPDLAQSITGQNTKIVFMLYYDYPPTAEYGFARCGPWLEEYRQRLRKYETQNNLFFTVDATTVVDETDLNNYEEDHVHLSAQAMSAIAELIAETIQTNSP